ncbi:hypothetical protein V8C37DRAFT_408573 [Trichoderma ceciliae]
MALSYGRPMYPLLKTAPLVVRILSTLEQWILNNAKRLESLQITSAKILPILNDYDVLVNSQFASLNYRDILIAQQKPISDDVVPISDGAGVVVSVGPKIAMFHAGDRVNLYIHAEHLYGVYPDCLSIPLVHIADLLRFLEASLLMRRRDIRDVLTQGTGRVSLFALAVAAGAAAIATISKPEKIEISKDLGAQHVINYREDEDWDETGKSPATSRLFEWEAMIRHIDSFEPLDPPFNPMELLASQIRAIAVDANTINHATDRKP